MRRLRRLIFLLCCVLPAAALAQPEWETAAHHKAPMNADETRAFMKRLATFVVENHQRRDDSPMRGMCYEYFYVAHKGQPDQFIQGEALDTMHDGAWFTVAVAQAYRATGDAFYKELLTRWLLPFYLKMLNHSNTLFAADRNDARPDKADTWKNGKEWLIQPGEKGFVPYWWDDGKSVSLEMRGAKDARLVYPGRNDLAGKDNPDFRLSGYSRGSSNHMAQDLALMLIAAQRALMKSSDAGDQKLCAEMAEAARNLQECRARHGSANIPACCAAVASCCGDADSKKLLAPVSWNDVWREQNHCRAALLGYKENQKYSFPGFADDQHYRYFSCLVRCGGPPPAPEAFRIVYDAYTEPMLFRFYCDDSPPAPGINVFDLHPYKALNGQPEDYQSDKKGPGGKPRPTGSRFGPQNMVCCGWALQLLNAHPDLWTQAGQALFPGFTQQICSPAAAARGNLPPAEFSACGEKSFSASSPAIVKHFLKHELGGGLRTWEAIFDHYGYIPTGMGCGSVLPGISWDQFSDTGGYAHLLHAATQWLLVLQKKSDWD